MEYLLFVDDTNFNKNKKSNILNNEIVSMAGCLISTNEIENVVGDLNFHLDDLKELYGADEFHFTDIYNRKKAFKGIDLDDTLSMIAVFAEIVDQYDLDLFVQTINKDFLDKNAGFCRVLDIVLNNIGLEKAHDLEKYEAYGLIMLLLKANQYIKAKDPNNKIVAVFCDEGIKPSGSAIDFELSGENIPISFESSKNILPLQIADFVAWSLSRTKQALDKQSDGQMKGYEQEVLIELQPIVSHFVGAESEKVDLSQNFNYDDIYNKLLK